MLDAVHCAANLDVMYPGYLGWVGGANKFLIGWLLFYIIIQFSFLLTALLP